LYIPSNTQWNITCSFHGGHITKWALLFDNDFKVTLTTLSVARNSGFTGIPMGPTLLIVVNTSNTSVVGISCRGSIVNNNGVIVKDDYSRLNMTVYGKSS